MGYIDGSKNRGGDLVDLIRFGQPYMAVIPPGKMAEIRREILIRNELDRKRTEQELERRLREEGL